MRLLLPVLIFIIKLTARTIFKNVIDILSRKTLEFICPSTPTYPKQLNTGSEKKQCSDNTGLEYLPIFDEDTEVATLGADQLQKGGIGYISFEASNHDSDAQYFTFIGVHQIVPVVICRRELPWVRL